MMILFMYLPYLIIIFILYNLYINTIKKNLFLKKIKIKNK